MSYRQLITVELYGETINKINDSFMLPVSLYLYADKINKKKKAQHTSICPAKSTNTKGLLTHHIIQQEWLWYSLEIPDANHMSGT